MGATAYGGKRFRERARVSGERPIGAASYRQHYNQASCQTPLPQSRRRTLSIIFTLNSSIRTATAGIGSAIFPHTRS